MPSVCCSSVLWNSPMHWNCSVVNSCHCSTAVVTKNCYVMTHLHLFYARHLMLLHTVGRTCAHITDGIVLLEVIINLFIMTFFLLMAEKCFGKEKCIFCTYRKISYGQIMTLNYVWSVESGTIDFVFHLWENIILIFIWINWGSHCLISDKFQIYTK